MESHTSNNEGIKKIRVCCSGSCRGFGAEKIMDEIEDSLYNDRINGVDGKIDLDYCGCRGFCARSPVVEIDDNNYVFDAKPETIISDIRDGGEDMSGQMFVVDKDGDFSCKLEGDFLGDL